MKVLKFGGTSIKTPDRILSVIEIVRRSQESNQIAAVFSAFGGVTDYLIAAAKSSALGENSYFNAVETLEQRISATAEELIPAKFLKETTAQLSVTLQELRDVLHGVFLVRELTPRTLDFIMGFGERISAFIIQQAIVAGDLSAEFVDTRKLIKTDETYGAAHVNFAVTNKNIQTYFKDKNALQVITGFIGSTRENETTTLGRSGSDYTAAIFGAALDATEIEIWTDVNGIMTADPRKVTDAFSLEQVSYEEAMELSHFGAKVVHPSAMQPAFEKNIPIRIRNTFQPEFSGTLISKERKRNGYAINGISSISDIALLRVQGTGMMGVSGISSRLFGTLAQQKINIVLITQASSEHTICFAVAPDDAEPAKRAIESEFSLEMQVHQIDEVIVEKNLSIVAAVGENMRHTPGIAGRLFDVLGSQQINVTAIAQGSSELNISAVISKEDETRALNAIHRSFFAKQDQILHLFIAGTGLIGSTLLKQLENYSQKNQVIPLKICGITNSRKMLFDESGIVLSHWNSSLDESGDEADIQSFVYEMAGLNLTNTIFVDCTASDKVANVYAKVLQNGSSVVAANKNANSADYSYYQKLHSLADSAGVSYLYETNVGAGLPIIEAIQNLVQSGDTINKIEAILSGTLSYIFNTFTGEKPFSEVVEEARKKGYTEPDPRDDLDGKDVARKLLILARELGYPLEMDDIQNVPFLPEDSFDVGTVEDFFAKLRLSDAQMTHKRLEAAEDEKALRYIATFEAGKAKIELTAVDASHPFYQLNGSDNIIAIYSDRYTETPLIIKGPGAGAEVTAAGVLSDILTIGKFNKQIKKRE